MNVKWHVVGLVLASFLIWPGLLQAQCPEGQVCLDESNFEALKAAATHQVCLDEQLDHDEVDLKMEKLTVVVDEEGRVYSPDEMVLRLKWCEYDLEFVTDPRIKVSRKDPEADDWGWRLRVRLGMTVLPTEFDVDEPLGFANPAIFLEPFYLHDFHLASHLSTAGFGLDVGFDLTRNLDVFAGVGTLWKEPTRIVPSLGVSVSIN